MKGEIISKANSELKGSKQMKTNATFIITREEKPTGWYYKLMCKSYNRYNKYDVHEKNLYDAMYELTDIFNNVIGVGIVFEIG